MAYRSDSDLEFLGELKSEDLNDLVYCLIHDRDGKTRWTEELTRSELYKAHRPDHHQYWQLIAAEIQCFGANSVVTLFRGGKGVSYKEVLTDVCDKMGAKYSKNSNIEKIESDLLMKMLMDACSKMDSPSLTELARAVGVKNTGDTTSEIMIGIFQAVFRTGGFKSYRLTAIVVDAVLKAMVGRGLSMVGTTTLARALIGPIGWTFAAIDIAGAAYRVTIPVVMNVAALRQKHLYGKQLEEA